MQKATRQVIQQTRRLWNLDAAHWQEQEMDNRLMTLKPCKWLAPILTGRQPRATSSRERYRFQPFDYTCLRHDIRHCLIFGLKTKESTRVTKMKLFDFVKKILVGARGFEPPTTCTPCRYATRLRYAPKKGEYITVDSAMASGYQPIYLCPAISLSCASRCCTSTRSLRSAFRSTDSIGASTASTRPSSDSSAGVLPPPW